MKSQKAKRECWKQALTHVGDNLYRSDATGIHYAIFKKNGKQIRRSMRTTDRELARRKKETLRRLVGRISSIDGRKLPFAEHDQNGVLIGGAAKHWFDFAAAGLEESTRDRYLGNIRNLAASFKGLAVRSITLTRVENWVKTMTPDKCAASSYNKELEVLKRILDYSVEHGYRLDDPTYKMQRRKGHKKAILIPTRDEYERVIRQMRQNDAGESADLCEMLARSGARKSEIVGNKKYNKQPLRSRDIHYQRRTFTINQSKNHESRTVPLFPMFEEFLGDLLARRGGQLAPDEPIIRIQSARTALETACRQLAFPRYCHHTMRHFFCSNAIEAGVDFKVIAGWLGHKDGGVLVARTYGHLRNEHSTAMAQRMTFVRIKDRPANVIPFPFGSDQSTEMERQ